MLIRPEGDRVWRAGVVHHRAGRKLQAARRGKEASTPVAKTIPVGRDVTDGSVIIRSAITMSLAREWWMFNIKTIGVCCGQSYTTS
jgi:hypothetical protein